MSDGDELKLENERLRTEILELKEKLQAAQTKLSSKRTSRFHSAASKPKTTTVAPVAPTATTIPKQYGTADDPVVQTQQEKEAEEQVALCEHVGDDFDTENPKANLNHNTPSKSTTKSKMYRHKDVESGDFDSSETAETKRLTIDTTFDEDDDDNDSEVGNLVVAEEVTDDNQELPFGAMILDRAGWLVGLLVLQSMSSFIIQRNEDLLQRHLVLVQFLTMLVGAGGNAGNQASVRVIRGLAVGTVKDSNARFFLMNEFTIGLCLSFILGVAGCLRAALFMVPFLETFAITASLFMIVMISVLIGATLPLMMKRVGIDPAHSSTTIQVLMDITGVTITVVVSALILDSNFGSWLGMHMPEGTEEPVGET